MGLNYKCPECGTALGFEGLCWSCRAKHHREEVNNWSLQEIEEKKKQVIEKLKVTEEDEFFSSDEYELFNDLITRGIDCKEIARVACKREIYYPSELYYKADGEIRDKLIEKLMATTSENEGSRLLGCLAMVGDEKAQGVLYELKKNPRPWRKKLYVDSDVYAEEAGWTFDSKNEYIKLTYDKCFSFELGKTNDEVKNKLKTITQGQKSDKILGLMAMTFRAFCDLADWDSVGTEETNKIETPHVVLKSDNTEKSQTKTDPTTTDMNLHYNIQIHLPETTNMAVYDAIFQSLKKHLM